MRRVSSHATADTSVESAIRLNLGCGRKRMANAVNVDSRAETTPDLILDLNKTPWPFVDSSVSEVFAYDVIEHLDDVVRTFEEIHRICRPGATVDITVPHFSCANTFADPSHRHGFGVHSFDYFTEGHEFSFYSEARFRRRVARLEFRKTFANKFVSRLANRYAERYESRWVWLFPAWFIYCQLECVKNEAPLSQVVRAV
jgi:SAM-dependent methyltransferase